jgi:hypothetical protein
LEANHALDLSRSSMAEQVAQAAKAFEQRLTGPVPGR